MRCCCARTPRVAPATEALVGEQHIFLTACGTVRDAASLRIRIARSDGLSAGARSRLWRHLLGIDAWESTAAELEARDAERAVRFEQLRQIAEPGGATGGAVAKRDATVIDSDVPRTDRELPRWREEAALAPLRSVLLAHCVHRTGGSTACGYCQGMNDLAAVVCDEVTHSATRATRATRATAPQRHSAAAPQSHPHPHPHPQRLGTPRMPRTPRTPCMYAMRAQHACTRSTVHVQVLREPSEARQLTEPLRQPLPPPQQQPPPPRLQQPPARQQQPPPQQQQPPPRQLPVAFWLFEATLDASAANWAADAFAGPPACRRSLVQSRLDGGGSPYAGSDCSLRP